jgi:hypothetical protein
MWPAFDQNHVAAALPRHVPAVFGKSFDDVASAEDRQ